MTITPQLASHAASTNTNELTEKEVPTSSTYRRKALMHYRKELKEGHFNLCVVCGFGVQSVLEVAHLNQNRKDNSIENLAILCPNCHKMYDIGLIDITVIKKLRDEKAEVNWKLRIKDAGEKAAVTKLKNITRLKKSASAKKAWVTRSSNSDTNTD